MSRGRFRNRYERYSEGRPPRPPMNSKAKAALWCLLAFPFTAGLSLLAAIVLSFVALKEIKHSQVQVETSTSDGTPTQTGTSTQGGGAFAIGLLIFVFVLVPASCIYVVATCGPAGFAFSAC